MAIEKIQLQVINKETDYSNIKIGNSKFTDGVWDLSPFITVKTTQNSRKQLRFDYIANEDMKHIVKLYAYHKLGQVKPQTVRDYINGHLPTFFEYCNQNTINSFSEFTKEDFLNFSLWMKEEKKVAQSTGYSSSKVIEGTSCLPRYPPRHHKNRSDKRMECAENQFLCGYDFNGFMATSKSMGNEQNKTDSRGCI